MSNASGFDRCFTFINTQLKPAGPAARREAEGGLRGVTLSRQPGCKGFLFADELAICLQGVLPKGDRPWTVFHRDLVEAVLRDHQLPARLASFMPEDRVGQFHDIIEDLFSLHPPTETLVRGTAETILRLAELGHAILIGRGASVITARLPGMLHIRLVASLESRLTHAMEFEHLDRKAALRWIKSEEDGRRRYLKRYYGKDISDPLLYHFVINTDRVSLPEAVKLVCAYALTKQIAGNAQERFS